MYFIINAIFLFLPKLYYDYNAKSPNFWDEYIFSIYQDAETIIEIVI